MKKEKIDIILGPISSFVRNESTSGFLLLAAAIVALAWANSPWAESYHHMWEEDIALGMGDHTLRRPLHFWINDGLMAMFFFVVGLELKREMIGGELADPRKALLPMAGAVGGMAIPALIFFALNATPPQSAGWGIPMATDIAFALGIFALLGSRVPIALKVFLTALAIADDIGAVLVIAFFYTSDLSIINVGTGLLFMLLLLGGNYLGVRSSVFYGLVGIGGVWLAFLMSGVHPTIAGVLAAMAIPARTKIDELGFSQKLTHYKREFDLVPPNDLSLLEEEQMRVLSKIKNLTRSAETPLQRLENRLHPFVSFFVMPLFAFANAGVSIDQSILQSLTDPLLTGTVLGLVVGKSLGITGVCRLMTWLGLASLPQGVSWRHMLGMSFIAGIGFTMSLFIANLAYGSQDFLQQAKLGVLVGSAIAGSIGFVLLRTGKKVDA